MANFPRIRSTFGVTPYNPERDTDEKRRAIFEHYQDQVSTQPMPEESMPWNVPFPPGVALQEEFDEMLQKRVVDPLSRAGYEDLGAGLAAVPSAAHSMIVPQTEFDVAGTIIPLPNVAKAMKKGKFRKIRNAMKAEDPENVGKIIAEQASKVSDTGEKIYASSDELKKIQDEGDPFKLSRFEGPEAEKLRSVIKRDLDAFEGGNTYIGENFHKPVWQKPNAEYKQPIPVPSEYLDKVGNHVGKNIMYGGNDPFQWLDTKYGASKAWLEKTTGQPRIIETQSDLIAHGDYMDKLTDQDKVIFHILGDDNRISRVLMPGAPSQARVIEAAKILADSGINVTIKRHNIPGRKTDRSSQVIPGVLIQDEMLRLDPEQIKAISKVGGHDFFNSPVIDADVAPIVNQGKDMARKEYEDIYDVKPRSIPDPPKSPKGDPEASLQKARMKRDTEAIDKRLRKSELDELDKEVDRINAEIDQLNSSDPDYNIMLDKRTARLEEIEKRIDESLKAHQRQRIKVVEPPKSPKGDPRLTKEQLGQLKAEIKKIESEIDQLNPSDPDYDFMLDKRKGRLLEIIETIDDSLKSLTRNRSKVVKPSKPPKGDPEASLRGPFQSIRSQLDVAPARMDERGRSFENIGQSDFMPYEQPSVPRFEDVQKRNYVESELGKPLPDLYPTFEGRLFQQQYMDKKPDEIDNVEVLMQILGGRGPAHEASILQSKMYPPKPKEFGKIKEQITEKSLKAEPAGKRLRVIKVGDGKNVKDGTDVTDSFGTQENLAGMSADELQKIVDATGKRYKVIEDKYIPSGQKNTQGKYYVTDWAGNEIDELGTYDSTKDAYDEITEWLRSKGVDEVDLDLEVGEFDVRRRKK
jgi:cell division protein FtsB